MAEQSRPMPKVRPLAPLAEKIQDTIQAIESWGVPLIDLLIRIWIAKAFFWAGVLKTTDLEPTIWLYTFVHPGDGCGAGNRRLAPDGGRADLRSASVHRVDVALGGNPATALQRTTPHRLSGSR